MRRHPSGGVGAEPEETTLARASRVRPGSSERFVTTATRNGKSILVIEDETDLAEVVRYNVEREGYECRTAPDGLAALAELRRRRPDLVVLDRLLPGKSGDEVAAEIRRDPANSDLPIIMLTAKAEESDQLVGFALGADDYVTKPFSVKVLLARIGALLRRTEPVAEPSNKLVAGPISLDVDRHEVVVSGRTVSLTSMEFGILKALLGASGRVLDREQLIDAVLGPTVAITDRTIDVHIAAMRRKLGNAAGWIQTIRGVGYTVRPPA